MVTADLNVGASRFIAKAGRCCSFVFAEGHGPRFQNSGLHPGLAAIVDNFCFVRLNLKQCSIDRLPKVPREAAIETMLASLDPGILGKGSTGVMSLSDHLGQFAGRADLILEIKPADTQILVVPKGIDHTKITASLDVRVDTSFGRPGHPSEVPTGKDFVARALLVDMTQLGIGINRSGAEQRIFQGQVLPVYVNPQTNSLQKAGEEWLVQYFDDITQLLAVSQ